MQRRTFITVLAVAVASCSPETSRAEQPIENLKGQELTDRLTRDLESVDDTNPNGVAESVVAITDLESAREFRRRLDEADQRVRERNLIRFAREKCAELRQTNNRNYLVDFMPDYTVGGRDYDDPCEALRANGLSERE